MRDQDGLVQRSGVQRREIDDALVPGKQTRVQANPRRAAGVPGKTTQVDAGRDSEAGGSFESVLADGHRHRDALAHALASGDHKAIKESSTSLDTALKLVKETITAGGAGHGAPRMQAAIELVSHAEPLLARARGGTASNATELAAQGTRGSGHKLPHLETIQQSFGRHDVSGVDAHVGGEAGASASALGANAFAFGNSVAFKGDPDLHLAAHEAAHVIQQRNGVQFKGGIDGGASDPNERHANAVADAVVSGKSAEKLLDSHGGGAAPVQRDSPPNAGTTGTAGTSGQPDDSKDRGGRPAKGSGGAPKQVNAKGGGGAGGAPGAGGASGGGGGGGSGGGASFQAGGDLAGTGLKTQLTAFTQTVKGDTANAVPPEGVHADPKKDSAEDHAKKVSQYEDGIDGIAGMIGDLDAFDHLCSAFGGAFSSPDQGKQNEALAQIRASKPFHQLSQMWQGALDGGQDSAAMQAAFEAEFEHRGFWGTTQQAYQLVRTAAKAQAAEDAKAADAKKKAREAELKGKAGGKADDAKAGGKTTAGTPNAGGITVGGAGQANAALLNASVTEQAAPIASLLQMQAVSDADFKGVMEAADQHAGLAASVPTLGAEAPRTTQILGQLKRAGSGFEESFVDTVKWGAIAHFGDKLAGGAVEKLIGEKVPIIGPIIQLAVDKPWSGKYWTDTGKGFSDGWTSMKSAFDMSAFKNCHSTGDYVGVMFAKFADLFTTFYSWLNTIDKLIGTLSAVCLILGAVLIGVGIALCWLGIGEALMAAGGWLVEAGEVLGDIALALMPICLALSALALVFRTAAAFLVPSDVYADQLAQEGTAANAFGSAAGTKVGLDTARTIEEATPNKPNPKAAAGGASTEGTAEGQADGADLAGKAKTGNDELAGTVAKVKEHAGATEHGGADGPAAKPEPHEATPGAKEPAAEHEEAKTDKPGAADKSTEPATGEKPTADKPGAEGGEPEPAEGETKSDDEADKDNKDDKDDKDDKEDKKDDKKSAGERLRAAAKELGRRLLQSAHVANNLSNNLRRLGGAIGELGELNLKNAETRRSTADRGLAAHEEQIDAAGKKARAQLDELGKQAEAGQAQIDELLDKLSAEDGTLSNDEVAELNRQLNDATKEWGDTKAEAEQMEKKVKALETALERAHRGAEQSGQPEEKELEEGGTAEDEGAAADSHLKERLKHEAAARDKRKAFGEAERKATDLEHQVEQSKQALDAAKAQKAQADADASAAIDKLEADPGNKDKIKAASAVDAHEQALARAHEMQQKAGKIQSAEQRRKSAEAKLDASVGKTVEVDGAPHEIVGFGPDGVVVKPKGGGAERTVPAGDVQGTLPSDFAKQVDQLAKARADVATLTKDESGGNAGAIAHDLQQRAGEIESRETRRKSPKKQAKWKRDKDLAAEWKGQREEAEAPAKAADGAVENAQKTLEKQEADLEETNHEKTELEDEAKEHESEADKLRRIATRHRRTEFAMEKGTEKIADWLSAGAGAVFGYLGINPVGWLEDKSQWLVKVTGLEDKLTQARSMISSRVAKAVQPASSAIGGLFNGGAPEQREQLEAKSTEKPEAKADKPGSEKPGAEKPEGGEKKEEEGEDEEALRAEALKVGGAQALYEQLLALRPPADVSLLADHRQKAADAFVRYRDAHDRAYQAFVNEQAVGKIAHATGQLAEDGKPLHQQAQQMRGPLDKSKGDEQQRQSTVAGAQTGDVKGADSRMGGLVMQLISKIGDNSDHLSQKPDAGGSNGGQMASGQDKAKTDSDQRTQQGKAHSQGQLQFLDQAQALRGKQEAALAGNVQALQTKQQSELASQAGIRDRKAQALADEAAARAECEAESGAFNEGYARASAWAKLYEAKRAGVKGGGGGGGES